MAQEACDLLSSLSLSSSSTKQQQQQDKSLLSSSASSSSSMKPTKSNNSSNTGNENVIKLKKRPSKISSKNRTTPTSNINTLKTSTADRFIPTRNATNFNLAHYKINQAGQEIAQQKILSYGKKAPTALEDVLYTQIKTLSRIKRNSRYIPRGSDRTLNGSDIIDDYYLNPMDWGRTNILATAIGSHFYLLNASTSNFEKLLELPANDYVSSVSWTQEGDYLAVGTTMGTVELWDCSCRRRLRIMSGHLARVGSLSWNSYVLSSGSRSGQIMHHVVRQREHLITTLSGHTQEVCGLKWSPDGRYLASGGNDNVLNIWQSINVGGNQTQQQQCHTKNQPLHVFTAHQAAVKGLAWCPWQANLLASGGGAADRHIRFWNCSSGTCSNFVDTKSQVCALLWSSNFQELISGHGFADNELIIWKYPSMTKAAKLTGHTAGVSHLVMLPNGTTVMSAGADGELRLWKCFVKNPAKVKSAVKVQKKPSALAKSIR